MLIPESHTICDYDSFSLYLCDFFRTMGMSNDTKCSLIGYEVDRSREGTFGPEAPFSEPLPPCRRVFFS